ncbi:MAG: Hpt domain-containing protein, partial [Gammaproteobacteria bacterium]
MDLDPEFIKQLVETFKVELEEKTQVITDNLLMLEKTSLSNEEKTEAIAAIFRAAHNIKGAAHGVGVSDVGEIAHSIESLFALIQKNQVALNEKLISTCLDAVDKMQLAMQAYIDKTALPFVLDEFLSQLKMDSFSEQIPNNTALKKNEVKDEPKTETNNDKKQSGQTKKDQIIHVSLNNLDRVSALMEKMQVNKIAIDEHYIE